MRRSKREHHRRAKAHLESGDDARLRYAALELRFCLETITYAKLGTYAKRLPAEIKQRWQPPQAMKALLAIEPSADQDFTMRFGVEDASGQVTGPMMELGTHRTIRASRLNKLYNKLGSYLHHRSPFSAEKPEAAQVREMRTALDKMLAELEPTLESTVDSSLAMVRTFECEACGLMVACNDEAFVTTGRAVCLNPECEAEYVAVPGEDGEYSVRTPKARLTCGECKEDTIFRRQLFRLGEVITCEHCEAKFRVVLGVKHRSSNGDDPGTSASEGRSEKSP